MDGRESILQAHLASSYYGKTRDEIIERIRLRDSAMTLFLSSVSIVGSVYGGLIAFLGAGPSTILYGSYLLIVICLQCRSAASVISQHHVLIGAGEHFLVTEFDQAIRAKGVQLPQWDSSQTMLDSKNYSISSRSKGHQMLIVQVAGTSALGFVVLQLIFGPHLNVFNQLANGIQLSLIPMASWLEVSLSVFATLVAIFAVISANGALSNASRQRKTYLEGMLAYLESLPKRVR